MFSVLAFSCGLVVALLGLVGFGLDVVLPACVLDVVVFCFDCGAVVFDLLVVMVELRCARVWVGGIDSDYVNWLVNSVDYSCFFAAGVLL